MARREKREEARTSLSSLLLIAVTLSPKNTYERAGRGRSLCSLVEPRHFSHNFWEGVNCTTPPQKNAISPLIILGKGWIAPPIKKNSWKKKQSGGKSTWNCMLLISMLLSDICIFPNPEFKFAFFSTNSEFLNSTNSGFRSVRRISISVFFFVFVC